MHDMSQVTLFEVSWEVCNKVGGIYAVVSTKVLEAQAQFGENYFLLGPDLGYSPEFEETTEPGWETLRQVMVMRNLSCRFGRWNIPGRPKAILVSFKERYNQNQLLSELWTRYGVDSLTGGWDYVEPVMFSTACGEVISAIWQTLVEPAGGQAVAQFHEWMCGAGLLAVKRLAPRVSTVFTTHATVLGRCLAGAGIDIYQHMRTISPRREAAAYNVTAKASMESVSAREADCFTTVSGITAEEASVFLGKTPDVVTPNGLDMTLIPDYSKDRTAPETYRTKLLAAVSKLVRHELPPQTRIMIISGRYEYHNKGVDVFLDAMAGVRQALQQSQTHVLALCTVMGGHSGINQDAVNGDPGAHSDQGHSSTGPVWISSHHVYDQPNDPILSSCNRLGLTNQPDNHVQVVFIPALMNGKDGFLNMPYEEVLAGCDLGVFPSWYEPWGYTPQESAAHSVPTVTTDLSGFGQWARTVEADRGGNKGLAVISRRKISYDDTVAALRAVLLEYATCPPDVLAARRHTVRALSELCSWKEFYPHYLQAFTVALENAAERDAAQDDLRISGLSRVLTGQASTTPNLHSVTAVARLPESLSRLRELAYNFWWAWQPEAWMIFSALDPVSWKKNGHNPVRTLEEADPDRLEYLAADAGYLGMYHRVMASFDGYMMAKPETPGPGISSELPVAYFSTEYGLHECLPIYSGGLGVLSGDHLKSSSDLNIPLVAVGLLYRNGYFRQQIDREGRQVSLYPENDFSLLPVEQVKDEQGQPLKVYLDLPGRQLQALVWLVRVGRISLYLLDTDTPKNTEEDRKITARLYEADRDLRLRQEILLGMGGVRLLRALGITPALYHMNEGHSAFLVLERIRMNMEERGMSFAAARMLIRGSCLFTTHTPVDAGNERFSLELVERYFSSYAAGVGLSWQDFLKLGRVDDVGRNQFEMTALALNFSFKANGVSRLHGYVSRHMWRQGWQGVPVSEVPIGYVTNGIHVPSYVGGAMRTLLDRHLGEDWASLPPDSPVWERVRELPDNYFWAARQHQKAEMLDAIRKGLPATFEKFNVPRKTQKEIFSRLTPSALIIGFARRFAPYKRATLLFADPERLQRILGNPEQPVIFVFSGKAHPADTQGIDLIQQVIKYSNDPRFAGRVFFVEDYSLAVSRILVQGCDVWLNTPRRPYEASGTSGQKVPVNGGLNLSISDGWWCEGYADPSTNGKETIRATTQHSVFSRNEADDYEGTAVDMSGGRNGWTIGPVVDQVLPSDDQNDYADAESLYTLLEESVLPLYFDRGVDDIPHKWLSWSKNSLYSLTAKFSSNRMVQEYMDDYYLPCAQRHMEMQAENGILPRRLSQWTEEVSTRFSALQIDHVRIDGMEGDILTCGQPLKVTMRLNPGDMELEELLAQLVIGPGDGRDFTSAPAVVDLKGKRTGDGTYSFSGRYTAECNGLYMYGVRVLPITQGLFSPLRSGLVLWG